MQKEGDAARKPRVKAQEEGFQKRHKKDKQVYATALAKRKLSKASPANPSKKRIKLSNNASKDKNSKTHSNEIAAHEENKSLSRHMLKKKLTESRKKHAKPNFELGKEVKELWETLRTRNLEGTERARITSIILQKMKGKATEMVTSHVMSRVLQTCLKFCSAQERASIYEELRPQFLQLAQNTYSHYLVLKMLDQAATDKKQLQKMIASLHGNVVAFLRHPVASAVVEHAYKLASSVEKQALLAEFFSPEYRLFKGLVSNTPCRLVDMLAEEPGMKRRNVLEHMTSSLQPMLEKGIVDHSIIHRALIEYLSIAGKAMATDVLQQLSGPLLVRMIHTREGAKVGVTCVSLGSRKERKKIIKGLKGHATKVACDAYGCLVLVAILDLVDDTEMLNKFIVNELAKNVEQIAFDRHGRRVFLHLLAPQKAQYMSAGALMPLPIGGDVSEEATVEEADEQNNEVLDGSRMDSKSKKDPFVRRMELLKSASLGEKLADLCTAHAGDLLRSPLGKDLIYEVAKGGHDGILWHVAPNSVCKLHRAVSDIGAQPRTLGDVEHIFEHYHASRTLRRLILEPALLPSDVTAPSFASVLWNIALKGKCMDWATGHSQKIVSAFQICTDKKVHEEAMKELQPLLNSGLLQDRTERTETAKGAKRKRAVKGNGVSGSD
ncbi:hypothetical protein GOP47_0000222 [Adiantum capillus-veneris]|uniref:PUM-HD domain-containing protein n=1 Tax=Adiantum capillus-veneris TaxID=13818 RepID=A0A9D4ZQI7_ADICA|nr:hypothetical protein GOP47_0000222 [Adiantum capillus-veneris]